MLACGIKVFPHDAAFGVDAYGKGVAGGTGDVDGGVRAFLEQKVTAYTWCKSEKA